jgi:hypothetical protein
MTFLWCYLTGIVATFLTQTMSNYADAPRDGKPASYSAEPVWKTVLVAVVWGPLFSLWFCSVLIAEVAYRTKPPEK